MRARAALGLAFAVALLIAAAACSRDRTPDPAVTTPPTPLTVTYTRPGDVLAMVLPSTGAQTRLAQGYAAFQQAVADAAARACLAPRGVPLPDGPPPMFIRFNDIPDLAFIEAHGFTVGTAPSAKTPAGDIAPPNAPATDVAAAQRECLSQGTAQVQPLRRLTDGLRRDWLARLSSVDADPGVRAAYLSFPVCLRQRGVDAADEDAFFRLVDAQPQAGAGEHDLAVAYATCMRPIEAVRERLRAGVRDQVVAAHPVEAARIRQGLLPRIADDERRFGIRLCFPAV